MHATNNAPNVIACAMAVSAIATTALGAPAPCKVSPQANREIVLDFYRTAFTELRPRAAFERHMSPDFTEHKPDVPGGGREDVAAYLEELIKSVPQPRWEVLRTVAEGDLVFLHARFTPAPEAPAYAVADVFRLKDCRIVEHWDVVAGPPQRQLNPHPRF